MTTRIFRVIFGIMAGVFGTLAWTGFAWPGEVGPRVVFALGAVFFAAVGLLIIDLPE